MFYMCEIVTFVIVTKQRRPNGSAALKVLFGNRFFTIQKDSAP